MTRIDKFDFIVDAAAVGRGIMAADVAAAAEGEKEKYLRLEAWLASRGYRAVVVGGKVTYTMQKMGRIAR